MASAKALRQRVPGLLEDNKQVSAPGPGERMGKLWEVRSDRELRVQSNVPGS